MAAGQLVPHELYPGGPTIMVPGYLAPKPALAMPGAPPMPAAPDMRVAGPGGGPAAWGNDIPTLPEPTPEEAQAAQMARIRGALAPAAPPAAPGPKEHPRVPQGREAELASMGSGKRAKPAGVDPSTLDTGGPRQAAQEQGGDSGDGMNPLLRQVFNEGGGGGGGPRRSGGMEVGSIKEQREPGREYLPEQLRRMGMLPYEQEVDPNADQPTWGNADPVMRNKLTGLDKAADAAGSAARKEYELQLDAEHKKSVAEREMLVEQSKLVDSQLATIADRRTRIANLQDTADRRMQEANTMEPRTREQIWEDKGAFAQVMGAISMAIGGYTQGLGRNGGHNPGLEMINKFLDSAVEDERYKHEKRQKIGLNAKSDLDKAMDTYGDLELATVDARNRKLASTLAMTQSLIADPGLDPAAKERATGIYNAMYDQYLEGARKLAEGIEGRALSQEVTYKQAPPTGGGGGGMTLLQRMKNTAEAKKAMDTIEGRNQGTPGRSIEGDKLNDVNSAMETLDAADAIDRDLGTLGADSDFDDPLSGPLDKAARVVGIGGTGRQARQSLERNTKRLARGLQQSLGKSDNDARLADEMAVGEGDAKSRKAAANTARQQALGRIQSAMAGMTPQQRETFISGLPPERRAQVQAAGSAVATPRRSSGEQVIE